MLTKPNLNNLDAALNAANIAVTIVPLVQVDGVLAANIPLVVPAAYPALSGAKLGYRAQEKQLQVTTTQVLQAAATTFYQAAGLEEVVLARHNAIGVAQKTLDDARIRLSAGVANRVDVTRAEQAVIKAKQDLLEAQGSRGSAYRNLATLLMLPPGSIKVLPPPEPAMELAPDEQLISQGLGQRPELASLDLTGQAASAQARSSLLRWAPSLSGFGNIRLTNATGFSGRIDYYAAGLQLDWQLFDGFVRDAQRHQFESQRRDAQLRLELLKDQVSDEVLIARSNILIRRQGLSAAQSSVRLAKEALALVRIQYEAGTATQLDLLTAQDKLVQADVGLAQARFDLSLGALNLRRALGESLLATK
jgi:outer membrane protein TolC